MINQSKVEAIITEFETTPDISLVRLMQMRRELSAQAYWYAKLLAQGLQAYRTARIARKATFARMLSKYRKELPSVAAAKSATENDDEYRAAYEAEYAAAGSKDAGYRLCGAIDQVLEAMKQEIADLRAEKKEPEQRAA